MVEIVVTLLCQRPTGPVADFRPAAKGETITQDTPTLENPAILDQLGKTY